MTQIKTYLVFSVGLPNLCKVQGYKYTFSTKINGNQKLLWKL